MIHLSFLACDDFRMIVRIKDICNIYLISRASERRARLELKKKRETQIMIRLASRSEQKG